METSEKIVFVTVGTTEFDSLIKAVCSEDTCKVLKMLGYTKLLLQIGRGEFQPKGEQLLEGFQVEFYRYKKSLKDDIDSASLVISHAGAGSVLETLGSNKPLLVVINDSLMGNHQLEVANQLYCDGHLYFCTTKTLGKTLEEEDFTKLKPFKTADPSLFASFVDSVMGFT